MKSLGVCIGATTLSLVEALKTGDGVETRLLTTQPHHGNPRDALLQLLAPLLPEGHTKIAVTGRKLRQAVNLSTISEPEAVEAALGHLNGRGSSCDAVISAGGENVLVYVLGKDGKICAVKAGNKCASGTGEFFVQQLRRIGMSVEEAAPVAGKGAPYRVSGRCSVFCKSDCTHAANKGIPKERIAAGLCEMIAGKIIEVTSQTPGREKVMVIGGMAQNQAVIDHLRGKIKEVVVPREAHYFEALGAAVWALEHETIALPIPNRIFKEIGHTFSAHVPLRTFQAMVEFKELERGTVRPGDRCLLGLDVGSTTTKAVLVRMNDDLILKSVYLRTNGNPVEASRSCFVSLYEQLEGLAEKIEIAGIGVTGSGRQIAGLYAMTSGIINEIIAHATGALFFDPAVDTIFEIGGQDAKYTYIHEGAPADYAMNDACSAGTGSFLEEAARETMGVEMEDIGALALAGENPPNFNDQCAAFISSDIKHAFQDGLTREDILAGLVYSICMNYDNRVKGNRPVGTKVFMQGGVCYNRAVPLAMAGLTGKHIVVPPEPGLVGAFGVALEIKQRLESGALTEQSYSLRVLKDREFTPGASFVCKGGKGGCDRKCEITRVRVEGKTYPFGGACNRWYNLRSHLRVDVDKLDFVKKYEKTIFGDGHITPARSGTVENLPAVGMNKSFFTNSYYPLYAHFFWLLGFRVLLPEVSEEEGVAYKGAAFCYPAELAHGFLMNLLKKNPDYLFLPQLKGMSREGKGLASTNCPFSQGEPYYLTTAYKDNPCLASLQQQKKILKPVLDFSAGPEQVGEVLAKAVRVMGVGRRAARLAYAEADALQNKIMGEMKARCLEALRELENNPEGQAIVVIGRSYNAFVSEANKGIPQKIASRGIPVLPHSLLPLDDEEAPGEMYWEAGRLILKSAQFIARHPQLFPCYITNFSCGPDSFLMEYFRHAMGKKPFLILELDSHVADAGLETRIEAFLDIIHNYRGLGLKKGNKTPKVASTFMPASFDYKTQFFTDSRGGSCDWHDPRLHLLLPSLGKLGNKALAAVFNNAGIRATALSPADETVLKLGRGNTSSKECLPLLLTLGSLLRYLQEERKNGELILYFMPTASGPCRFGQYAYFIRHMIAKLGLPDVALFSPQGENSYKELGGRNFILKLWSATILADIFQEIYSLILANAKDKEAALGRFAMVWEKILAVLAATPDSRNLKVALREAARDLKTITGKEPWPEVPVILLTGEIYVRHDDLSRQSLVEQLAKQGWAVKTSGVVEWIYYTDYCFLNNLASCRPLWHERPALLLKSRWMQSYERAYRKIMAGSGILPFRPDDVPRAVKSARDLVSPQLTGEAILTIGGAISEVPAHYCGVIALGPFGCMPNRLAEAILSKEMGRGWQLQAYRDRGVPQRIASSISELPFLAIESDGNPFPQVITAKMEVFLSQAARLHQAMRRL